MSVQFLRISAAFVLLGAAAFSVAPSFTSYVSLSAVVNARIVSVEAPFDGVIETPSKGAVQRIREGEELFSLENNRYYGSEIRSLNSNLEAVEGEILGLNTQRASLETLRLELLKRKDAQVSARMKWFDQRLLEAAAVVEKVQSLATTKKEKMDRIVSLAARGMTPKIEQIDAESEYQSALFDLENAKATLKRLEVEKETMDAHFGVDLSSNDMEQIMYRLDEIVVREADIGSRLLQLEARRSGLVAEIEGLSSEIREQNSFTPLSTVSGVVWEASEHSQSTVIRGQSVVQILDCGLRFVEVELPEKYFENVHPGDMATVTLKGSEEYFKARIAAVYGSGALPNQSMKAANPRISLNGGLRVIVVIDPADIEDERVIRTFCDVGRSAEVFFDLPADSFWTRTKDVLASAKNKIMGLRDAPLATNDETNIVE